MGAKGYAPPMQAPAAPQVPKEETLTEEEKRARENERRRQQAMEGRDETILTSDLGAADTDTPTKKTGIMGV